MADADTARTGGNYHSQALSRGLLLLDLVAAAADRATLASLHAASGLPKSTLVRLLSALCDEGYLVRVDDQPSYRLGHRVLALAKAYLGDLDLGALAHEPLAELAAASRQTANLAILDGTEVLHVAVERPDRALRFDANIGEHGPAWCTALGKALLAELPDEALAAHVPPEPWTTPAGRPAEGLDALRRELARVRRRGHASDDNEYAEGLTCLAVLVRDDQGPIGAVSVSGASGEFAGEAGERLLALARTCADRLAADGAVVSALRAVGRP